MKKLTALLVLAIVGTFAANAQFSAKAGLNNLLISYDGISAPGSVSDNEVGFYAGAGYEIPIDETWSVEPSALFSFAGDFTSLYIPVLAKYKIGTSGFAAAAGPQIHYVISDDYFYNVDAFGMDLGFGGSYDFTDNLFVEARFAFELFRGDDTRLNTFTIGAGWRF